MLGMTGECVRNVAATRPSSSTGALDAALLDLGGRGRPLIEGLDLVSTGGGRRGDREGHTTWLHVGARSLLDGLPTFYVTGSTFSATPSGLEILNFLNSYKQ